jgi:nitrogen PTS system EIIA component
MVENMPFLEFLNPDGVLAGVKSQSKKQVLHDIASAASSLIELDQRTIYESLLQRERLGSTGIGDGIAIPHGKLPGLTQMFALIARLEKPIDFDAIDEQPVDLLVLLLAPEEAGADHLKALARVARALREPGRVERIRAARDEAAIYAILNEAPSTKAA